MILDPWFWALLAAAVPISWLLSARLGPALLAAGSFGYLLSRAPFSACALLAWALVFYRLAPRLAPGQRPRRRLLAGLILGVLGYLAYFKYLPPLLAALASHPVEARVLVPLGISYYTLKLIHYAVATARGEIAQRDLGSFLCYLYLLPIFPAGPIERFGHFLAHRAARWQPGLMAEGLTRIAHGLIKKFLLADCLLRSLFGALTGQTHPLLPVGQSTPRAWAYLAAARAGCAFVNVHSSQTARQLRHVVQDCRIRILFTDAPRAEEIRRRGLLDRLDRLIVADSAASEGKVVAWADLPCGGRGPDVRPIDADLAALIYTSGSTGPPKGVMHTHRSILAAARSIAAYLRNTPADRVLGLLPMSFSYGLSQVTTMFLVGGTVVLQPLAMPSEIVRTLTEHCVTGLAAVPSSWAGLLRFLQAAPTPLPSLRYVTSSGDALPGWAARALPKLLPGVEVYLMFGLTEGLRATYLPPELFETKTGSIGRAIPNVEVFVVDEQKGLCGPGEQGELLQRGSCLARGYWNNPQATAERFKPCRHLRPLIGDEKVLHTGDIVRADEDGLLWFVGRADSLVKCGGFLVSPAEVEVVVGDSGLAAEAAAFAVADDVLGQAIHLAVTWPAGSPADDAALLRFCRENLPAYMLPRRIHTRAGPMPRTATGKIDRAAVARACAGGA